MNKRINKQVAQDILLWRYEHHQNQENTAKKIGISRQCLSMVERCEPVTEKTIFLCEVFLNIENQKTNALCYCN